MADGNGGSPLEELRTLIVGPEQTRLEDIEQRLEDSAPGAEEVSAVLPAAIALGAAKDDRLKVALAPLMEESIHTSVRRDPQPLADAIFPIIGPAIRKAIAAAIGGMIQRMNQSLEHAFSIQGLRWRLEAMRTGTSFGEIVLRHSLVYRVEQVFLVHREGGLLLLHVSADSVPDQGAEMVAGMLSAIQDFARDSFHVGSRDTLETMQVGELNVLVEDGPQALIAAVVRGHPPQSLRTDLEYALENIHARFGNQLASFEGDASVFVPARPVLERCLAQEVAAPPPKGRWRFWLLAAVILLALALFVIPRVRASRQWNRFIDSLRSAPGIVITESGRKDGRYYVAGLRDPAARSPDSLLALTGLSPYRVLTRWEPYHSLDPALALSRVRALVSDDIADVERTVFYYPVGQDQMTQESLAELANLTRHIQAIGRASHLHGVVATVTILGETDETGDQAVNLRLGHSRAERVRNQLQGAETDVRFVARGAAPTGPATAEADPAARAQRRKVTFSVALAAD
jgi:OOP family OmpA-OmpF porin